MLFARNSEIKGFLVIQVEGTKKIFEREKYPFKDSICLTDAPHSFLKQDLKFSGKHGVARASIQPWRHNLITTKISSCNVLRPVLRKFRLFGNKAVRR